MGGLFISYRRQDAASRAGRLHSDLTARYGRENVFLDITDLQPGADWTQSLHQAVAACDTMLVLIGPQWLSAQDASGRRRIDDPHDFIRSEVAAALRLDKRVIPVLVGGAAMPAPYLLPDNLRGLAVLQAALLRDEQWHGDIEQLYRGLKGPTRARPSFFDRLAQAFDVLLGRGDAPAALSPPITMTAPAPSALMPAKLARARHHDVFVSYSSDDGHFADDVVKAIEMEGPCCWIAHRDIPPGAPS